MSLSRRRKILFSLVPLLVVVLAWEGLARILGKGSCQAPAPVTSDWREMKPDNDTIWSLVPDRPLDMGRARAWVGPNGVREREEPRGKTPRDRRILTLGDSSVFGWEVADGQTFQERLEGKLNTAFPQYTFDVVNLGVPGFSTVQSLALMDRIGWRYAPDVVLEANLFSDCNIDVFQDAHALALLNPDRSMLHRVLRGSRLYCSLFSTYADWYAHRGQSRNRVLMPGVSGSTWVQERLNAYIERSRVPLDDYADNLEKLRLGCVQRKATMVLAILAQESDVGLWTVKHRPPPSEGEVLPWTPYRVAMTDFAARNGLPLVSMPDAFAAAAQTTPPADLFLDAVHPSATGAEVMAQALFTFFGAHTDLLRVETRGERP